jgi:hypothetical protein
MSKHRKRAHHPEGHLHTCPTCQHQYTGHFCNNCGEKIFHPHDLSLGHLLEDAVDKFTHFDLKIPKSILLLFNPGYLTEKFLMGIRKPFANPIQLFLIANVIFFLFYKVVHFTDFTPAWGDEKFFKLSNYKTLFWAKPIDDKIETIFEEKAQSKRGKLYDVLSFDAKKIKIIDSAFQKQVDTSSHSNRLLINALVKENKKIIEYEEAYKTQISEAVGVETVRTSAVYSKSFIFLLILLVAPFVFLFYRKSFQNIGTVLIFCTHFVSFYILFFAINVFAYHKLGYYLTTPFALIYESTSGLSRNILNSLFGFEFEFHSLPFLIAYLFFAFRRLFKTTWYYNLFASYCISRIFFFLCFGIYKDIILWIAISNY